MDIVCQNCGATNRNTSRFCARCGEPLPHEEAGADQPASSTGVDLPWLRAVQDHAVKQTEDLRKAPLDQTPAPSAPPAQQPQSQNINAGQPETAQATTEQQSAGETPAPESGRPATITPRPIRDSVQLVENAPQEEAAPAAEAAAPAPPLDPNERPPDWVVGILEPSVTPPANPAEQYEPEELAHVMPWVHPEPGAEPPPTSGPQSLPPWLRDVTVQETLQSSGPAPAESRPQPSQPQLDDFALEGIEPFLPPTADDENAAQPTPANRQQEQVPTWLRSISGGTREERAEASLAPPYQEAEAAPAPVHAEPVARNMPVRAPRPGAVDTLAALLQPEAQNAPRRVVTGVTSTLAPTLDAPVRRRGMSKWLLPDGLIYLLILATLLAVLIVRPPFGDIPAASTPDVAQFYNAIESVPIDKPVLVVYDWDATRSAEMSVLSQAVMRQLMSRRLKFVAISTVPQGPGFAQQIIGTVSGDKSSNYGYNYGTDYLILGYIPGNEAALRAAGDDFSAVLPLDYVKQQRLNTFPVLQGGKIKGTGDFALVVDLASDEAALRNWIEQVGARTQVPIIAAVPQSLDPIARTYKDVPNSGLKALLSGTSGSLAYNRQLVKSGTSLGTFDNNALADRLNAQSVAQLLVAVVIVAAFIGMATRRIFRRSG